MNAKSLFKILFLHPTFTFGGAERTAFNLLRDLSTDKFSVTLVTSREIAAQFSGLNLAKVVFIEDLGIDVWFRDVNFANLKKFMSDVRVTARLLKDESPDIAFGMMYYASSLLSMAKKFFRIKTMVVSSPRGPLSAYIHTFYRDKKIDMLFWKLNFVFSCRYSDGLVVASNGTKKDCIENYKARPENVTVIHNGIDADYIRKRSLEPLDVSIPPGYSVISTAGRLAYEKNLPLLLNAFALIRKTKRVKLLVLGDGHERPQLEKLADALGVINDIHFLGYQENPYKFIRRSDLFVHTCLLEGFGNVIVEAMACGIPVVATDCPYGPGEIIKDGESGILVPMDSVDVLAETMSLILNNEQRRKELSKKGYNRSLEFSVDKMVRAYEDFFLRQT
jgi:glycosyltransferase involved in cell wall biosynthesis